VSIEQLVRFGSEAHMCIAVGDVAFGHERTLPKKRDRLAAVSPRMVSNAFRPVDPGTQTGPCRNQE